MMSCMYWTSREINFVIRFLKNTQISNLMKIHPVEPELFQADGRSERRENGNM